MQIRDRSYIEGKSLHLSGPGYLREGKEVKVKESIPKIPRWVDRLSLTQDHELLQLENEKIFISTGDFFFFSFFSTGDFYFLSPSM